MEYKLPGLGSDCLLGGKVPGLKLKLSLADLQTQVSLGQKSGGGVFTVDSTPFLLCCADCFLFDDFSFGADDGNFNGNVFPGRLDRFFHNLFQC